MLDLNKCSRHKCRATGPKWEVMYQWPTETGVEYRREIRCDRHFASSLVEGPRRIQWARAIMFPVPLLQTELVVKEAAWNDKGFVVLTTNYTTIGVNLVKKVESSMSMYNALKELYEDCLLDTRTPRHMAMSTAKAALDKAEGVPEPKTASHLPF